MVVDTRSAGAAAASPPAAQAGNPTVRGTPAYRPDGSLAHGCGAPRHQPDRTARQITMSLVSIRAITGDVARLAGFGEKATGAPEGQAEGRKQ
jgi:hypothetical protein